MELEVCRSRCQHNACNTTHNEGWDESNSKQVCRCKTDLSTPHRKEPVKDFDPGRYGNQHRGDGEKRVGYITQTCCKHVMRPYHEAQEGNQDGGKYHGAISEQPFTREGRDNLRDNTKCRQNQNVYFRVPEDPEDVLPEYRVTATCDIEEIRSQYTVKRQSTSPTVMAGKAKRIMADVINVVHVNIGIRM